MRFVFILLRSSLKFLAVIVKFFIIQVGSNRLLKNIIRAGCKKIFYNAPL